MRTAITLPTADETSQAQSCAFRPLGGLMGVSLVTDWVCHDAATAPDGTPVDGPFYTLRYDFVLNPAPAAK